LDLADGFGLALTVQTVDPFESERCFRPVVGVAAQSQQGAWAQAGLHPFDQSAQTFLYRWGGGEQIGCVVPEWGRIVTCQTQGMGRLRQTDTLEVLA
jgi:hypothetical protein